MARKKKDSTSTSVESGLSRRSFVKGAGAVAGAASVSTIAGAPAAKAAKTTLNITTWMGFEPGRKEAWEGILDKFNKQSSTIEVKL